MTLDEIKQAIEAGHKVYWKTSTYQVIKDSAGQYLIHCIANNHYIGLTHADGTTLNGDPDDFFATVTGLPHDRDRHCTVDPATNCCVLCGAEHGSPCPDCHGRGYHNPGCSRDIDTEAYEAACNERSYGDPYNG